jgi:hypothetical protein
MELERFSCLCRLTYQWSCDRAATNPEEPVPLMLWDAFACDLSLQSSAVLTTLTIKQALQFVAAQQQHTFSAQFCMILCCLLTVV